MFLVFLESNGMTNYLNEYLSRDHYKNEEVNLIAFKQNKNNSLLTTLSTTLGLRSREFLTLRHDSKYDLFFVTGNNNVDRRINMLPSIARKLKEYERPNSVVVLDKRNHSTEVTSFYDFPSVTSWNNSSNKAATNNLGFSLNCASFRVTYLNNRWKYWYEKSGCEQLAFKLLQWEVGDNYNRTNPRIIKFKDKCLTDFEFLEINAVLDECCNLFTNHTERVKCYSSVNLSKILEDKRYQHSISEILRDNEKYLALKAKQWSFDFAKYNLEVISHTINATDSQIITANQDLLESELALHKIIKSFLKRNPA